jgi:UDP-glucose 4-epimerase
MRILVTGGGGALGRELVPALLARGHGVTVLDTKPGALASLSRPGLRLVEGAVEDAAAIEEALRDVEAVFHLAWSFSDDPRSLLERDLRGHAFLLEASRAHRVRHLVYTSTAVVYGKPVSAPIDEDHPLRVLEARKPAYGIAKEFAEKLALLSSRAGGPPATILRFWWAFGETIGGRHLEEMMRTAAAGRPLVVPGGCGGSFLSMEDFVAACDLVLPAPDEKGQVFNLASAYVTWEEVAAMVVEATGAGAAIDVVPPGSWTGPAFLSDRWELDDRRIREKLGFEPRRDPAGVRQLLAGSIRRTWEGRVRAPSG